MVIYGAEHPNPRNLSVPLLERVAKQHWGLIPPFTLKHGPHGKPFFQDYPDHHFNISHSGQYILCALDCAPVGIDIQIVKPRRTAFLDRICSLEERKWLLEQDDKPDAFTILWTLKESICKYSGRGLTLPISEIQVPLPRSEEQYLKSDEVWYSLFHGNGWHACVCSRKPWDGTLIWFKDFV